MDHIHLSEEEKYRVALQVDHFIDLISKRYGVEPGEVVEAIKWVRTHKNIENKVHLGAIISIVSVMIGAVLMALWEGIKHMVNDKTNGP